MQIDEVEGLRTNAVCDCGSHQSGDGRKEDAEEVFRSVPVPVKGGISAEGRDREENCGQWNDGIVGELRKVAVRFFRRSRCRRARDEKQLPLVG